MTTITLNFMNLISSYFYYTIAVILMRDNNRTLTTNRLANLIFPLVLLQSKARILVVFSSGLINRVLCFILIHFHINDLIFIQIQLI